MAIINRNISYTNRGFTSLRSELINFTQTYFPNTYTDFDAASTGMMFMEQAAYVGDVLSFYLDSQIQETYLQFANQNNNLYEMAYMFGYKPKLTGLATTTVEFYQQIPSKQVGNEYVPDYDYALLVPGNTSVNSDRGITFTIEDPIDFTVSSSTDPTEVSIAQITSGEPSYYLLKKQRNALSGEIKNVEASIGAYQEFPSIIINDNQMGGIINVFDGNGNRYSEVNYLAQELVFEETKNTNINDPNNFQNKGNVPYILQTRQTPFRFTSRVLDSTQTQIQFGSGNPNDTAEIIIPNPDNVGLGLTFEKEKLTTAYSPTNFIFTNTYGIAPSETTISIEYLSGGGVVSNVPANSLTFLNSSNIRFQKSGLSPNTSDYVFNSIAVNNPNAASGGRGGDTITELRENIMSNSNTQLRAVTADDYLIRTLSMPGKYGIVTKAYAQKPLSNEEDATLDLYVLGQNNDGTLSPTSPSLKQNIKTYLSHYRMIGDSINIKDAFIINLGVEFQVITRPEVNNNQILRTCISIVNNFLNTANTQINQPIILSQLEIALDSVNGVQTVKNVIITNKNDVSRGYSQYAYDIDGATQNKVIYPSIDPMIFEIKFPNIDIKGQVVNL
tara:strand:- start:1259 stop:3100 length:1842 start_codon:yes stop_codon:yes gene_type:complete